MNAEDFTTEVVGVGGGAAGVAIAFGGVDGGSVLRRAVVAGADEEIAVAVPCEAAAAVGGVDADFERDG